MPPDALALYATVILLLPMACFFLSSPTFLLVGLEIPEVTQLLRGLFNGYFIVMCVAGVASAVAYVISGRPVFAVGALAVAAVAVMARRWFLQHMDVELQARAAGEAAAVPRLRALHLKGMLLNGILLATVIANVPLVV
ncbi:hypothetical protein [Reyranella soli]|jgi:hypothetical protein|uniref:DUF4149 domain-containing protein n=1 Tax=Reyranella soli TaxID=1230389 RepID=A0A512NGT0_9HYPH|nr:hypothetical protein [Reyranella soli]GEP58159.1 hypothetical protein RSO01_53250 [Reyranella soli]